MQLISFAYFFVRPFLFLSFLFFIRWLNEILEKWKMFNVTSSKYTPLSFSSVFCSYSPFTWHHYSSFARDAFSLGSDYSATSYLSPTNNLLKNFFRITTTLWSSFPPFFFKSSKRFYCFFGSCDQSSCLNLQLFLLM